MLRVTVELIPHGDEARAKKIGSVMIANDGSGTEDIGNYDVTIINWEPEANQFSGRVTGFKRTKQGAWYLLIKAILAVDRGRRK